MDRHEAKLIKMIVEEVWTRIKEKLPLHVAEYTVGLDTHIECVSRWVNDESDAVLFIGIHGLPGIGKTTIAKSVYNAMFQKFEGSAYLADVRENSKKKKNLISLQKKLVSAALKKKEEDIKIDNVDKGINIIQKNLCNTRVLIILDDVDKEEQLSNLVVERGWFHPGSRIIITTRYEHLLSKADRRYKVGIMKQNESLQLFSFHAFEQDRPLRHYLELSLDVVEYVGGLPLALVTLGTLLFRESEAQWKSELKN